jgi:hypothetical protein
MKIAIFPNFRYEPQPEMEMPQVVEQAPSVPEPPLVFHGETVLPGSDSAPAPKPAPLIGKVCFLQAFVINEL